MIRILLSALVLAALGAGALVLTGQPGHVAIDWLGWRVDLTAAAGLVLLMLAALAATLGWQTALWIAAAPARAARARAESRRRQGAALISRGFLAARAGDGSEARRLAQKAVEFADEQPALVRILAAQAAEEAGDDAAAEAAYKAMLGFPDMRLAAQRGLMQLAQKRKDPAAALRHAEAAYGMTKTARWAWRALLEARLQVGDWQAALQLADDAVERKIVSPVVAERTRTAVLTAYAAQLEHGEDLRGRERAAELAAQAAKLKPDFAPGVALAARMAGADGRAPRALQLIEAAWRVAPHPALALIYRDLKTDETPRERAKRLQALAALNPEHRESRILVVEQALLAGDLASAEAGARKLAQETPTVRVCGLLARAASAAGDIDRARAWAQRAASADQEPEWSDIGPDGEAFAYAPADWARLVSRYGETGELLHPRFERGERVITDLPDLPIAYQASAPFVAAAERDVFSLPIPDDPGIPDDAKPRSSSPAPKPAARARRPRRTAH